MSETTSLPAAAAPAGPLAAAPSEAELAHILPELRALAVPLILPTIHSNGTSKAELVERLCEASQAIDLAYAALKACAPNGRDWYPQGDAAFRQAQEEHMDRLRRLDGVKKDVDALTLAIDRIGTTP